MIYHDIDQRSPEWFDLRLGKITGSQFKTIMSSGKTRDRYMGDLIRERIVGERRPYYESEAMAWGTACEPLAKHVYTVETGLSVTECGFHELNEWIGVSLDGMVGENGIIEIKCPNSSTHQKYLLSNRCPKIYYPQVQGNMWVSGKYWCHFVSFDPRSPKMIHIVNVARDDRYISKLKSKCDQFIEEMKHLLGEYNGI